MALILIQYYLLYSYSEKPGSCQPPSILLVYLQCTCIAVSELLTHSSVMNHLANQSTLFMQSFSPLLQLAVKTSFFKVTQVSTFPILFSMWLYHTFIILLVFFQVCISNLLVGFKNLHTLLFTVCCEVLWVLTHASQHHVSTTSVLYKIVPSL